LEDESGQDIDSGFDVKANKHMIRAGTFEGLVRKLTHHIEFDSDALYSFLLTYRSFATPDLLFETLVRRYNSIPRNGLDKTTFGRFYKNKLLPIRLRVCQMIKTWVEFYPFDFAEKPELLLSVRSFADMAVSTDLKSSGESLRKAVDKVSLDIQEQRFLLENPVLTHALDGRSASQKLSFGQSSPSVAVDHLGFEEEMQLIAVSQRTDLLDWPVRDLARQVSVFEFRLFRAITPKEFLKQAWMKANKEELAPNILKLTDRFNRFSRWCAARVMQSSDVRERRAVFITLVNLAEECRKLNNMNAIFEIVAALNNAAVHRLKRTKEDLPSRTVTLLSKLEKLISREGSCRNLREALHQATPPCVPYLGMYLSDLTFVDEGNKDKVRDGMINFNKCRLLSHVIREVQIYQQTPYSFSVDEQVQSMLVDCDGVSDDELFARSLELEPRGS
jgi:son of sevenless-like protein